MHFTTYCVVHFSTFLTQKNMWLATHINVKHTFPSDADFEITEAFQSEAPKCKSTGYAEL